ncbi:DUF2252 domain-containing protein [Chamaesiphon sp.]|uniref:DUF2252 domain-containing protein n=1 Tax=Chamaesiphon sp. TaxID=2814140 RepID=UPI0035944D53
MVNRDDGHRSSDVRDIWKLIQAFDRQRNPKILTQKYIKMRKNAFGFFRGTCHLFYRDLPKEWELNLAPFVWICGDLHLENFGTYKGENSLGELRQRQVYFGINDFDEGVLAPCTWDITRLVTSIFLAADSLGCNRSDLNQLAQVYLTSYTNTLIKGRIRGIAEDNTSGIVADLIKNSSQRKRIDLLNERTELNGDRQLKFDGAKILKISTQRQQEVIRAIDNWAQSQASPAFFKVLDVGFRVAGMGSLGVDRYIILVAGKGSPDRNYLLDFKQQSASALEPYLTRVQPQWKNQAIRVMNAQQIVQSAVPALLAAIEFSGTSYLLRELQPTEDKITFNGRISLSQLAKLVDTLGEVTASAHLHGSSKFGAAVVQDLINFGRNLEWQPEVLIYADFYARQVQLDYQDFCKATQDLY